MAQVKGWADWGQGAWVKQGLALVLAAVMALGLTGCVTQTAGLVPYRDSRDGYSFLYPNGWQPVQGAKGPDVVLHDIIEPSENVSVVIGPLESVKDLTELGSASDVGLRLQNKVIAAPGSGRTAELLNAERRDVDGQTYYLLEYAIALSSGSRRHDLVSVGTNRGKVYTLSVSTLESRWPKVRDLFYRVANSFALS